jgi:hypothetical protein
MDRDRDTPEETRREPRGGTIAAGGTFTLWYGFMVGPVAWSLHLLLTYPLVPPVCPHGLEWVLHLVTAATALACVIGAVLSWRAWNRLKEEHRRAGDLAEARARAEAEAAAAAGRGPADDPAAAARDAALEVGGPGRLSPARARFMALGGVVLSGFFAVVIVIEGLPPFFGPC